MNSCASLCRDSLSIFGLFATIALGNFGSARAEQVDESYQDVLPGLEAPVITPTIRLDDFLGKVHVYGNASQILPSAKAVGISWIATVIDWKDTQITSNPDPQSWHFSPTADISAAAKQGMKTELVFLGSPPTWTKHLNNREKLDLWKNFCGAVALHYDGSDINTRPRVETFTILSEFNCEREEHTCKYWWPWLPGYEDVPSLYTAIYTSARRAIKAVRPEAVVMTAGPIGTGLDWLPKVFQKLNPQDYPEMLNIHPFHLVPEEVYDASDQDGFSATYLERLEAVHSQIIERYYGPGSDVKLSLGEAGGYSTVWCSEEEQAKYTMRQIILSLSTQYVQRYMWGDDLA